MFVKIPLETIDELIRKLGHFTESELGRSTKIHFELQMLNSRDRRSGKSFSDTFSDAEKNILKQALRHCLTQTALQRNFVEELSFKQLKKTRVTEDLKKGEDNVSIIPSSRPSVAPKTVNLYSTISPTAMEENALMAQPDLQTTSGAQNTRSLVMTLAELRRVLVSLPLWVPQHEFSHTKTSGVGSKLAYGCSNLGKDNGSCHSKCKSTKDTQEKQNIGLSGPQRFKPRRSLWSTQIRRPRPRDGALALLRTYCKHFSEFGAIQDHENLLEDLRECTFQPNVEKYRATLPKSRNSTNMESRTEPSASNDLSIGKNRKTNNQRDSSVNGPMQMATRNPKYSGVASSYHSKCVHYPACGCTKKSSSYDTVKWEETLRQSNLVSCSRCCTRKEPKPLMDFQKAKRYYSYDWGRYIRLQDRHLKAVCLVDNRMYDSLFKETAHYKDLYNPPPTLVEWRGAEEHIRDVVFCAKTPIKEHQTNWARNMSSLIHDSLGKKELPCPLKVVGLRCDPVEDLERRLKEAKPIDYHELLTWCPDDEQW